MAVSLETLRLDAPSTGTVEWRLSDAPVGYEDAVAYMQKRAAAIAAGKAPEQIWLLEHPPLYTAGTSADEGDLTEPDRFPVYKTGRGGQYTYHGPGQRVAYVMLSVKERGGDIRCFVRGLEKWLIDTLDTFNVKGERRERRVGVWVDRGLKEDKVAALGIRVSRGISFHGISFNVDPDLTHYEGIVPCGITAHGVTSLVDLGHSVSMSDVDAALRASFEKIFGHTVTVGS